MKIHQNIEHGDSQDTDRPLTMKERAKKARHDAYVLARERRKNDPRTITLKENLKQARREASAQVKERRKNDPAQMALKEKRKNERQMRNNLAKEQRKARAGATKTAIRTGKDSRLRSTLAPANTLGAHSGFAGDTLGKSRYLGNFHPAPQRATRAKGRMNNTRGSDPLTEGSRLSVDQSTFSRRIRVR